MPTYSKKSLDRLNSCHPDLQRLFQEIIKHMDITIVCGHRNKIDQEIAYKTGKSKARWPQSKHNSIPSQAVDVAPVKYHDGKMYIDWDDIKGFKTMAAFILAHAEKMKIKVRWGGAWDGTPNKPGQLSDFVHFELIEAKKKVGATASANIV